MSKETFVATRYALKNLCPKAKMIILISEKEFELTEYNHNAVVLEADFDINWILDLIGEAKCVGIVDSEKFNESKISQLINALTCNHKSVVVVNDNPISCNIHYPPPRRGTKHSDGNYEYKYASYIDFYGEWKIDSDQHGWGVRVIDNTQTDYVGPLTMIKGYPVTNMSCLFNANVAPEINLIDWDTSKITNMSTMFSETNTPNLDLSSLDTSNVTNMNFMFYRALATNIDISNFNTSKVRTMNSMFAYINTRELDLNHFDTANVLNMGTMFNGSQIPKLDLHSFIFHKDNTARAMFAQAKIKKLVLSSIAVNSCRMSNTQIPQNCEVETR